MFADVSRKVNNAGLKNIQKKITFANVHEEGTTFNTFFTCIYCVMIQ